MSNDAVSFEDVKEAEITLTAQTRQSAGLSAERAEQNLFGVAFSGGGIRSATFNLGVVQALARAGLLSRVDYLSTVSGGGYIGSWLSAWIHRSEGSLRSVEEALAGRLPLEAHEPAQVSWLRRFSNYLTPRVGVLSTDTLAGVATYVRNLLLNLIEIVAALGAVLILPLFAGWMFRNTGVPWLPLGATTAAIAVFFINLNLHHGDVERNRTRFYQSRRGIFWLVVVPLILGAASLGFAVARMQYVPAGEFFGCYFLVALILSVGLQVGAWLTHKWRAGKSISAVGRAVQEAVQNLGKRAGASRPAEYYYGPVDWIRIVSGVTIAVAVGLLGLWVIRAVLPRDATQPALALHATVWAMPGALLAFALATILFIGIVGRTFSEETREWWSRLGGWMIGLTLGWLAAAGSAVYGPYLLGLAQHWLAELGAAWIASTAAGVIAGRSRLTAGGGTRWLEWVAKIAPYVFMFGLLVAVSFLLHGILVMLSGGGIQGFHPYSDFASYADCASSLVASSNLVVLLACLAGLLVVVFVLAWTVDVNVFSFHMFYRNRLVRCYLGASNEAARKRRQHPFTGFDPMDSPKMTDLAGQRPYHLVNTTLNLTQSKNLAWQERKAASFTIAPLYCGYDLEPGTKTGQGRYQRTQDYLRPHGWTLDTGGGWLGLGTALTISGAAASPNMGHHTSTATAFLLTVFNVRLGWWMQNTRSRDDWGRKGPRCSILWLLRELFAMTDDRGRFIYLSDGGHFENLGIYELVRRRSRFILAVDAGQDRQFRFEDLGNAVRKCEVDLNTRIEIGTRAIVPDPTTGLSLYHCTVGEIRYPDDAKEPRTGLLLYVKPSLSGNEPADVSQYAKAHPDFPHESTADQWFAESQFESYRKLGQHIMSTVLDSVTQQEETIANRGEHAGSRGAGERDLEWIFVNLKERWFPPSRSGTSFTRHGDQLKLIEEALRKDEKLRFMDVQLLPEWPRLISGRSDAPEVWFDLPKKFEELRAGFYVCTNMLQLMENVYLDLNLEEEWEHPDNRGWMNLFKHWSWSAMFMVTFAICCGMYGARFQRWCERRLGLRTGRVEVRAMTVPEPESGIEQWLSGAERRDEINFVEAAKLKPYLKPGDQLLLLQVRQEVSPPFPEHRGGRGPLLVYTFGVAAARESDMQGQKLYRLTFFRIQDHVRRMGLARRAMRALAYRSPVRVTESALDEDFQDKKEIERILNSVLSTRLQ